MKMNIDLDPATMATIKSLSDDQSIPVEVMAQRVIESALKSPVTLSEARKGAPKPDAAEGRRLIFDPKDPRIVDVHATDSLIFMEPSEITLLFGEASRSAGYAKPNVRVSMSHFSFMACMGSWASRWRLLARVYGDRMPQLFAHPGVEAAFEEMIRNPTVPPPAPQESTPSDPD